MKPQEALKVLFLAAALCGSGCVTRLGDLTVMSTKNIELSQMGNYQRQATRVAGKDTKHIILFFPLGAPSIEEAADRAIERVPGGIALVDGVCYKTSWWIPYIYGQSSLTVEGTVLVDPRLRGPGEAPARKLASK